MHWMSALFALVALVGFTVVTPEKEPVPPTAWNVDRAHSQVKFSVRHLGFTNVEGNFGEFDAALTFDPADLTSVQAEARIETASINTGIAKRDEHLRSADFFDAANHPQITFVSKGVKDVQGKTFKLAGDLTIRGITRPVVLDAELLGTTMAMGKEVSAITASTTINRHDFGLTWNSLTEAGGVIVGEDVKITIDVEATR